MRPRRPGLARTLAVLGGFLLAWCAIMALVWLVFSWAR